MKFIAPAFLLLCFAIISHAQTPAKLSPNKQAAIQTVNAKQNDLTALSDKIWAYAEIALKETQSSKALADYAESNGFRMKRGVANMPTAFVAEYGSGKPIIGILGEFDALPGLSQKAVPYKEPLVEGAAGHGCGHNLFGAGSLGAAIAIKELIASGKLKGTIRFYGTPAEEDKGGKVDMAAAGLFNDLDVCLDWHPDFETKAGMQSTQAIIGIVFEFKGKSAHAASDPWNGRSALDAAELFTTGVNFLREHLKPSARVHYVYKTAGNVPNVVPDEASVWMFIRDSKRTGVAEMVKRIRDISKGAALMAGVKDSVYSTGGNWEQLINETGAKALQKNLESLGSISYTDKEIEFANRIMKEYGIEQLGINGNVKPLEVTKPDPDNGSTDVGDVSFVVPEISLLTTTAPFKSPWHSWVVTACGGMSIGHKGMIYSAKALAITMIDLFENENLRNDIRKEFLVRRGDTVWKPLGIE